MDLKLMCGFLDMSQARRYNQQAGCETGAKKVSFGRAEKTLPNQTAATKLVLKLMAKTLDRAGAIGYNTKAA
jgi:hypothetical protein